MRYLGLALICFLVLIPGVFSLPPTDRDESRYVQASRQMLETGDFVDIRFQDEPRYKKPVGIYWLHSAAAKLTGHGGDAPIWVFRSVSVAGGILAVLTTYWFATFMFGRQSGVLAAMALVPVFGLAIEARIAKTDAVLLATVIFAQAFLARIYLDFRNGRPTPAHVPLVFWATVGAGILIKGPITPLICALTAASLTLYDRDRHWLKSLNAGRGVLVAAAVVLPWFLLISWKNGMAFWQEAVGRDLLGKVAGGQESHGFPPGYYSLTFAVFVWPVAYLGLRAGLHLLNGVRTSPALRFLAAWYVPFWLVFELIPTKLPHYMLPAYPALAIAIGWYFANPERNMLKLKAWQTWLLRLGLFGLAVVTIGLAFLPAALQWQFAGAFTVAGIAIIPLMLGAGWLGSPAGDRFAPLPRMTAIAILAGGGYGLLSGYVLPSIDKIWMSREVAAVANANRPCASSVLAVTRYHEPSMVVLGGTQTLLTDAVGAARHMSADPQCAIAAVEKEDEGNFRAELGELAGRLDKISTVTGFNYSKGSELELGIYALR